MKFKHKSNGEIVTIKNGDAENVWYRKEGHERVYLLQADVFFTEYESITMSQNRLKTLAEKEAK